MKGPVHRTQWPSVPMSFLQTTLGTIRGVLCSHYDQKFKFQIRVHILRIKLSFFFPLKFEICFSAQSLFLLTWPLISQGLITTTQRIGANSHVILFCIFLDTWMHFKPVLPSDALTHSNWALVLSFVKTVQITINVAFPGR